MKRHNLLSFGVALTALAGFVDAIGFIRLGGLYTSFMSGNTTQLAVAIGHAEAHTALLPLLLILSFLVGAFTGGALSALTPARWSIPVVLAFEACCALAAFAAGIVEPHVGYASLFLALAMGAQNAVLAQVQGFRAGATFVTGALFAFGHKLALAITGRGPPFGWVGDAIVWLALLVGAVAGTLAHIRLDLYALAIPVGVSAILAAFSTLLIARSARHEG